MEIDGGNMPSDNLCLPGRRVYARVNISQQLETRADRRNNFCVYPCPSHTTFIENRQRQLQQHFKESNATTEGEESTFGRQVRSLLSLENNHQILNHYIVVHTILP